MNKYHNRKALVCLPIILACPSLALSQTERQLDAHEHGHSFLNIATSDAEVLMELITPAANVIGYEHAPESESDHQVLDAAVEQLGDASAVFNFNPAAECTLASSEIVSSLLEDDDHDDDHDADHDDHDEDHDKDHDDDHDSDHDDHDKDHDDDHHDDDGHDDHDDHDEESHSEFHVTWQFECANAAKLETLDVQLFSLFGGFEEIDVSVAGDSGQQSFELTPENSRLTF